MIVAIGTKNPAKVKAVTSAFKKVFPKAQFVPIHVESGVSEQPIGTVETRNGAMNRANAALRKCKKADLGVGIEGGAVDGLGLHGYAPVAIVGNAGAVSGQSVSGIEF